MPVKRKTTKKKLTSKKTEATSGNLSSEFKKLGKNLEMNIKSAWHSKQRRELEDQVGEGLNKLVQGVDKLYKKSQEKDFDKKVKSGLFKAVKKANIKLEQVHDKWEPRQENKK